jgi:transposase
MTDSLPIPDELWAQVPPDAQAAITAVFLEMLQRSDALEARVRDLEARLKLNSTNSSKPPSSDPIGLKRRPPAPATGRKRGGQPGHRKARRALVPPEEVAEVVICKPDACRRCQHPLVGHDPEPLVHQVAELPPIQPIVVEYRLHRLACPRCRETTCGGLPAGVPRGAFGPRLQAVTAVLAGTYRLSKRQIQQLAADLFGLSISTGMVSKLERASAQVLEAPYNELAVSVHQADAIQIDETSWRQDHKKVWLWTTVTAVATVFTIARNRSGAVAKALLGSRNGAVVSSDRFSAYEWIAAAWRQVCWAHLRRDFQAMIDRGGAAAAIGGELLGHSHTLFRAWHRVRDGTIGWEPFQRSMRHLRRRVRGTLERGSKCGCARTAATCWEILKVEEGLWAFARVAGIEPTNNAAERALRHAVIWRRISGGTDSECGSRFVERMLTVVATCRQQGRNVLDYLTSCFEAHLAGQGIPSLRPAEKAGIKVA